jgi:hypothetical protein
MDLCQICPRGMLFRVRRNWGNPADGFGMTRLKKLQNQQGGERTKAGSQSTSCKEQVVFNQ